MKRINYLLLALLFVASLVFTSCEKDGGPDEEQQKESILPGKFKVDIPGSISDDGLYTKSYKSTASNDTLCGDSIYQHLRTFIFVGESSADIVNDIITAIVEYNINQAMSITYESEDDGRSKKLVVEENVSFDGKSWEFSLTITDVNSTGNADGGKGMQVFWNRNPVDGTAIIKPFNLNKNDNWGTDSTMFRVDYTEAGTNGYDEEMIVYISNLPLANPIVDPYSVSNMKMFAGRKGDVINVYGNSDHPNARFFTNSVGFNWAFVASGNRDSDIGVAEVGLPPSNLDATTRSILLEDYSIDSVFRKQILELYPNIQKEHLDAYLHNTDAPGYFNSNGFIQGGTSPGNDYSSLESEIDVLAPYNPINISNLSISFK
jgi:hypothetical protein